MTTEQRASSSIWTLSPTHSSHSRKLLLVLQAMGLQTGTLCKLFLQPCLRFKSLPEYAVKHLRSISCKSNVFPATHRELQGTVGVHTLPPLPSSYRPPSYLRHILQDTSVLPSATLVTPSHLTLRCHQSCGDPSVPFFLFLFNSQASVLLCPVSDSQHIEGNTTHFGQIEKIA